jgi:hypothetical protein
MKTNELGKVVLREGRRVSDLFDFTDSLELVPDCWFDLSVLSLSKMNPSDSLRR